MKSKRILACIMKKIARFTFTILCIVLSLDILQLSVSAESYRFDDGNILGYQIIDGEVHITSSSVYLYVEIPEEIDGYPVTTIDTHAFHINPDVEVIILPESLVTLKSEAIAGCDNVTSIIIPAGVQTIGSYALGYDYVELYDEIGKKYSDFTIYGYTNTAAETYAIQNGFTFIALEEQPITTTTTEPTTTIATTTDEDSKETVTSTITTATVTEAEETTTTAVDDSEDAETVTTTAKKATTTTTEKSSSSDAETVMTTAKTVVTTTTKKNSSSPKTGDTGVAGLLALGVVAIAAAFAFKKKHED
ncbi:MAG: leucine-rich repeat domain-containing protein [Ruminococcus sp.]|nr:leucine-rich repeat domain-containing protein [Ruminococcus sp.]